MVGLASDEGPSQLTSIEMIESSLLSLQSLRSLQSLWSLGVLALASPQVGGCMGAVAVTAAGLLRCMRFFKHMWVSHFGIVAVGVSIDVLVGDGGCHSGVGVVGCASFFGALFVFVLFRRGLGELSLLLLDELSKITAFASFQVGSRVIGGSVIMLMLGCGAGSAHWLEDSLEGIMLMLGCGAGSAHSIEDALAGGHYARAWLWGWFGPFV